MPIKNGHKRSASQAGVALQQARSAEFTAKLATLMIRRKKSEELVVGGSCGGCCGCGCLAVPLTCWLAVLAGLCICHVCVYVSIDLQNQLPNKVDNVVFCELSELQIAVYKRIVRFRRRRRHAHARSPDQLARLPARAPCQGCHRPRCSLHPSRAVPCRSRVTAAAG